MSDFKFGEFCRICIAESNNLISIETLDYDNIPLIDKLKFVNDDLIQENDRLPKWICKQCKIELTASYNFQKRCIQSLNILNECYSQIKQTCSTRKDVKFYITDIKSVDNKITNCGTSDFKIKDEIIDLDKEETNFFQITDVRSIQNENFETVEESSKNPNDCDMDPLLISDNETMLPIPKYQMVTKKKKFKPLILEPKIKKNVVVFQCKFCSKESLNKTKMVEHIKSHGIELYCSLCLERFSDKGKFLEHLKSHKTIVEKKIVCKYCRKSFQNYMNFNKHFLTHEHLNIDEKNIQNTEISTNIHKTIISETS